jgi:hypothetical protein
MRILLRHLQTGEFYAGNGDWTKKSGEACDFKFSADAIVYATQHGLDDAEVLFDFGNAAFNFSLGLGPEKRPAGEPEP